MGATETSNAAASAAAKALVARRWGSQRPVKLARELAERASELPDLERRQLLNALSNTQQEQPT
jgi:hypothetical protein